MNLNFADLCMDGLDSISLDTKTLEESKKASIPDYVKFTELLLASEISEDLKNKTITLKELKKNNFLTNYIESFSIATSSNSSSRESSATSNNNIKRAEAIKICVNSGYIQKDLHNIKASLGVIETPFNPTI